MSDPVVTPTILQFEVSECALAALAMLLGHRGCAVSLDTLRQASGVSRDGITLPRLRVLAAHYGYRLRVFRRELDDLRSAPLPAMVYLNFNHMVVVEAADQHGLQINDPASGPRPMTWNEMDRAFSGLLLTLEPGEQAQQQAPLRTPAVWQQIPAGPWRIWALLAAFGALGSGAALSAAAQARAPVHSLGLGLLALLFTLAAQQMARQQLRDISRRWAWSRLSTQGPGYLTHRSPQVRHLLLQAPAQLANLLGGRPGYRLLALLASLPAGLCLAQQAPVTAAMLLYGLLLNGAVHQRLHLHRRSPWRRTLALGDSEGSLNDQTLAQLETLQLSAHDEDALLRQCGAIARGSEHSDREQRARAQTRTLGLGLTAALLTGAVWLAPADQQLRHLILAALVWLPWLRLEDLHLGRFQLPLLAAAVADLCPDRSHVAQSKPEGSSLGANPPGTKRLAVAGQLSLNQLCFGYGKLGPRLFRDLQLDLAPGHRLGISGPAGCGKTTLGKLMSGLLSPDSGTVASGGRVLRVTSQSLLFDASVADNLRLGQDGLSDSELLDALALAGMAEEVTLRGGLQARVEAAGRNWSGGQRRRLMLARALVRRPRILVIDEALDGVDQDKETAILDDLRLRQITVVLISQRRASLARCDQQLVLGSGQESPSAVADEAAAPQDAQQICAALPPDPVQQPLARGRAALAAAARQLGTTLPDLPDQLPLAAAAEAAGLLLRPLAQGGEALPRHSGLPLLLAGRDGWRLLPPPGRKGYPPRSPDEAVYGVHPRQGAAHLALRPLAWAEALATLAQWGGALWLVQLLTRPQPIGMAAALLAVVLGTWSQHRLRRRWHLLLTLEQGGKTWDRALGWSAHWVHDRALGPLASALAGLTEQARQLPLLRNQGGLSAVALVLIALVLLRQQTVPLAPLALLAALALGGNALITMGIHRAQRRRERSSLRANQFLHTLLAGLGDFIALGAATPLHRRWLRLQRRVDAADGWQLAGPLVLDALNLWLPLAAALLVGLVSPPDHAASPDTLIGAAALAALAPLAASRCGKVLGSLIQARRQSKRWQAATQGPDEGGGALPAGDTQTLRFEDVHFGYDGRSVLRGVNLTLAPGEVVALCAPTGSGKTTLLRLLLGFQSPQRGHVRYGALALADTNRRALRRHWGALQQDEALPLGLLRQLLGGLHPGAGQRARAVAAQVDLDRDLAAMAMGLATPAHAELFSAGQQQKILLGRALGRGPRLLVLDEALSALDQHSRQRVMASVRALGASCVVVTHDPDTLALCDRQWLLQDGQVHSLPLPGAGQERNQGTSQATACPPAAATPEEIPNAAEDPPHPLYRARALALADSGARLDQAPVLPPWPALALVSAWACLLCAALHG